MRAANLALKFTLELAALAFWGGTVGEGAVSVLVAIAAPALMIVLWGRFAAPKASRRLSTASRVPFELAVFAAAAAALAAAGEIALAAAFAALVCVNSILLTAFKQWEH